MTRSSRPRAGIDLSGAPRLEEAPSRIYVAADDVLCGVITYACPVRREAGQVIGALRDEHGVEIHLLTGDKSEKCRRRADAAAVAARVPCRG